MAAPFSFSAALGLGTGARGDEPRPSFGSEVAALGVDDGVLGAVREESFTAPANNLFAGSSGNGSGDLNWYAGRMLPNTAKLSKGEEGGSMIEHDRMIIVNDMQIPTDLVRNEGGTNI